MSALGAVACGLESGLHHTKDVKMVLASPIKGVVSGRYSKAGKSYLIQNSVTRGVHYLLQLPP